MVVELARLMRGGIVNDIMAIACGVLDGYLMSKMPLGFIVKNIGIPVASAFTRIPDPIRYESEGMLGLFISVLLGVA